ncbi:MAG: hypothetical protein RLZZ511_3368 [Cyanobacteriota bacterium]|jgi:hypothetical protein
MYWAIASGIEGNFAAFEAMLKDVQRSKLAVETLYLLGDIVGPRRDAVKVVNRIQTPQLGDPTIVACLGWWEEQCMILHGLGQMNEPQQLIDRYGKSMAKLLWDAVPRSVVEWIRNLEFGFAELDCLLIHGSSMGVDEELTPETPVMMMLDRLNRMNVNQLFCGRSGQAFEYHLAQGSLENTLTTLDQSAIVTTAELPQKRVVGVGSIGREAGVATYLLFNPGSNELRFRTVKYSAARGFGAA